MFLGEQFIDSIQGYFLFIVIASATIASPGPGILLTVSNALKYGVQASLIGILGVAVGMLCIAVLTATSLAVLLASSAMAFSVIKWVGAIYLIYLGIKMWRSSSHMTFDNEKAVTSLYKRFFEGLLITILNPKPIFFFMALFPQFIDTSNNYAVQFMQLALTFSSLVMIIHIAYALAASRLSKRLHSTKNSSKLNKLTGSFYMLFGIGLASSSSASIK